MGVFVCVGGWWLGQNLDEEQERLAGCICIWRDREGRGRGRKEKKRKEKKPTVNVSQTDRQTDRHCL
jgi:hypothetical protein